MNIDIICPGKQQSVESILATIQSIEKATKPTNTQRVLGHIILRCESGIFPMYRGYAKDISAITGLPVKSVRKAIEALKKEKFLSFITKERSSTYGVLKVADKYAQIQPNERISVRFPVIAKK